ncbi:MAG TPA: hypothetical protein VFT76_02040 [Actinomycetota bacterium]|nr:hypothetical protein [Actinomycetota bacterium]
MKTTNPPPRPDDPRPDLPDPFESETRPPRRRRWVIPAIGVGVLAIGVAIGAIADGATDEPTRAAGPAIESPAAPTEPAVEEPTDLELAELGAKSANLITTANEHNDRAIAHLENFEIDASARETDLGADAWAEVGVLWEGTDEYLAETSAEVARLQHSAAEHVRSLEFDAAVSDIDLATALIDSMTAHLEETYL